MAYTCRCMSEWPLETGAILGLGVPIEVKDGVEGASREVSMAPLK